MIEAIEGLPDGVIGFRFSGHVTGDEYTSVLLPPLKERIDRKEKIRLFYAHIPARFGVINPDPQDPASSA